MNKATQNKLRAFLEGGDCAAALALLDAAPPPVTKRMGSAPKRPKFKGNKFADPAPLLASAPCGCGLWLDLAVLCPACEASRDEATVRDLIAQFERVILNHETRLFPKQAGAPSPGITAPRNWSAFIFQSACRYKDCAVK